MNTLQMFEILNTSKVFYERDPFCIGASVYRRSLAIKQLVIDGTLTHIDSIKRSIFDADHEYTALVEYAKHHLQDKQLHSIG